MAYVSKAQQRFMESDASPLSEAQKKEWRGATDFRRLPERVGGHLNVRNAKTHKKKLQHS